MPATPSSWRCGSGAATPAAKPTPLRVTLVAACAFPCRRGTAARVLGQATALARQGLDVEVVTYDLSEFQAPPDLVVQRIPRVPTHRSTEPGPSLQKLLLLDPLLLARTLQVSRRRAPDVLHGHHAEGALVALATGRLLGVPVVFDAHTSLRSELPSYGWALPAPLLRQVGARLDRFLATRCDHVFAVTEALRAELLDAARGRVRTPAVTVIPMGLEPEALAPLERRSDRVGGGGTVVYTGGLSRFQRLDLLGRAFERVLDQIPGAQLRIVSDDPAADLEAAWPGSSRLGAVQRIRPRDLGDVLRSLEAADVAVSPRTAGAGFPQKILNYMGRALPVVACEGSGEALRHGETGWVVPNDDPEAFAAAIVTLLRDPDLRRRLGRAARADVEQRFGWDAMATRMIPVYQSIRRRGPSDLV